MLQINGQGKLLLFQPFSYLCGFIEEEKIEVRCIKLLLCHAKWEYTAIHSSDTWYVITLRKQVDLGVSPKQGSNVLQSQAKGAV